MENKIGGPSPSSYETYIESWNSDTMAALQKMNINSNTTIDISFAMFSFSWNRDGSVNMNGMQMSQADLKKVVDYIHSRGGSVKIAFGGANTNYYLSNVMGTGPGKLSPGQIAGALASIVKQYGINGIDLDLEDKGTIYSGFEKDAAAMIHNLRWNLDQQGSSDVSISLTLEGQSSGSSFVPQLVKDTKNDVSHYNFMEYNIWIDPNGQGPGKPNSYVQQIEADMAYYIKNWGVDPSQIMLGLMPGKDEMSPKNNLTLADAKELANWAKAQGYAGVMTWDLNRDYEGQDGNASEAYSQAIQDAMKVGQRS